MIAAIIALLLVLLCLTPVFAVDEKPAEQKPTEEKPAEEKPTIDFSVSAGKPVGKHGYSSIRVVGIGEEIFKRLDGNGFNPVL